MSGREVKMAEDEKQKPSEGKKEKKDHLILLVHQISRY